MATKYLGSTFDIHGGGLDLVFPHHENEIAQSKSAGDGFARYWMHNAWLTIGGEKMSKSLGNSLLVSEIVKRWRPAEIRYYLGAAHYRSNVEFSDDALDEAAAGYRRIENFVERAVELLGISPAGSAPAEADLPAAFVAAMDDDLGVPLALAQLHNAVRDGNNALAEQNKDAVLTALASVHAMAGRARHQPTDLGLHRTCTFWWRGGRARRGRGRTAQRGPGAQGLRRRRHHPRSARRSGRADRGHPGRHTLDDPGNALATAGRGKQLWRVIRSGAAPCASRRRVRRWAPAASRSAHCAAAGRRRRHPSAPATRRHDARPPLVATPVATMLRDAMVRVPRPGRT